MKMRLATEFSRRRKLQLLTKQRPPEVQNDLLFGITTKSICLARKRSWRLVWLSSKRSLRPKSIRVTWEYKFGLDDWMLCFLFLFNIFLPLYFHLAEVVVAAKWISGSWSRKSCRSAEGARSANCCRSPTRSRRRPCRPMPMASVQILNSALPQALRQQLPVKYRKHLWLSWTYLN